MTTDFIPICGSSIIAIGTLALFADHNRRTGWKKQRGKVSQWFTDFYEGAYVDNTMTKNDFSETSEPAIPVLAMAQDSTVNGFSQQLLNLRGSLGTAGTAPAAIEVPIPVRVAAQK